MLPELFKTLDKLIELTQAEVILMRDMKLQESKHLIEDKENCLKGFVAQLDQLRSLSQNGYKMPPKDKDRLQEKLTHLQGLSEENNKHLDRFARAQERFLSQLQTSASGTQPIKGYRANGHRDARPQNTTKGALTFEATL